MPTPTIYLFEDDAGLRNLLIELLQDELQAQVVVVPSIPEVLRLCAVEPPDRDHPRLSWTAIPLLEGDFVLCSGRLEAKPEFDP